MTGQGCSVQRSNLFTWYKKGGIFRDPCVIGSIHFCTCVAVQLFSPPNPLAFDPSQVFSKVQHDKSLAC